jgi:sortase A
VRRTIGAIGRALVTIGILILLFVAYQLWGTGLYEAQQQSHLKDQFKEQQAKARATTTTTGPGGVTTTTTPAPPPPSGDAVAIIKIPKIGVDRAVVQGVGVPDLRKGPGHYPLTPMPGQLGNAAIAGHRTTYGQPFYNLNELGAGDEILITTLQGTYRYLVTEQLTVKPRDVSVLDPTPDPGHLGQNLATLTLTTCTPRYSAAQRLVIHATLDVKKSPKAVEPPPQTRAKKPELDDAGPAWGSGHDRLVALEWALFAIVVGALWWLVFHRYHRWTTWIVGAIPFAVVLFYFYVHLERLLPQY